MPLEAIATNLLAPHLHPAAVTNLVTWRKEDGVVVCGIRAPDDL
jgi:hypothetical protein